MTVDLIGWASSLVLLLTLTSQVRKQWRERTGEGVSAWVFVGQTVASLGFTIYSALVKNWVFTITNASLLLSGLVGCGLTLYFKTREQPRRGLGDDEPSYKKSNG